MCAGTNGYCVNTYGSFECRCPKGYAKREGIFWNSRFFSIYSRFFRKILSNFLMIVCLGENKCKDVNECELETHNCWGGGICRNTWGSFKCRCPGTILLFFKIKSVISFEYFIILVKSLKDGFSGDGYSCEDENECKTGSHDCHELALCENTLGSFKCTCKKGTHGNGLFCDHDIGPDQFFDF